MHSETTSADNSWRPAQQGLRAALWSLLVNACFVIIKVTAGILGNSYALIADGAESAMDMISSIIVWSGLRISQLPPDKSHHYGHGKAESLAAMLVAIVLLTAAAGLSIESIRKIQTPGTPPAPWTLIVLAVVVVGKEWMYRFLRRAGRHIHSTAIESDAWHHRSDALTSIAAFIGITIAWIGGPDYAAADAWAALAACLVIAFNGQRIFRGALKDIMDAAPPPELQQTLQDLAAGVAHVKEVHHCHVRKSGLGFLVDIHVVVDGEHSVRHGHEIGHAVKNRLIQAELGVRDVLVHVEPDLGDGASGVRPESVAG